MMSGTGIAPIRDIASPCLPARPERPVGGRAAPAGGRGRLVARPSRPTWPIRSRRQARASQELNINQSIYQPTNQPIEPLQTSVNRFARLPSAGTIRSSPEERCDDLRLPAMRAVRRGRQAQESFRAPQSRRSATALTFVATTAARAGAGLIGVPHGRPQCAHCR